MARQAPVIDSGPSLAAPLPQAGAIPLLRVTDLAKTFGGGRWLLGRARAPVRAVDGVSFALDRARTLGLVGETGSGKSTIGRLVLRLIDPTAGRIELGGQDITHLGGAEVRRLRSRMQMVFQDPLGSLDPRMTVGDLVTEPMIVHGVPRAEIAPRLGKAMRQVGLDPSAASRYPHEFSGGQRQRIGIARAMVLSPEVLVLDEPVSALDVSIQAQILNVLRGIQRTAGVAFLFIAHDLAVVRHVSDEVAVLYLGRIVERGPRDAIYARPRHPYTVSLLSAVPVPDPVRERQRRRIVLPGEIGSGSAVPSGCRFHPRCPRARTVAARGTVPVATTEAGVAVPKVCAEREPHLEPAPGGPEGAAHVAACYFAGEPDA